MEDEKELIKIMMDISRLLRAIKDEQVVMQAQINYLFSKLHNEPQYKD